MARTTAEARPRMRASDIVIDDERLSLAAKGVFVTIALLGKRCRLEELERRCLDKPAGIEAALRELTKLHYVRLDGGEVRLEEVPRFGIPEV